MKRDEMIELVSELLRESQKLSGRDDVFAITEATVPVGELADFDSLNGVEATHLIEERLRKRLPDNIFVDGASRHPLSIGQVVDCLLDLMNFGKER